MTPPAPPPPVSDPYRTVRIWLWATWGMVFVMVLIGGITRLTGSGLSMVEWRPLMGALPPIGEDAWQAVFEKYKQSPQYLKVNHWMRLEDFEAIFFWEYLHRLFGRLIGVVFFVPWVILALRGRLVGPLRWRTFLAFVFGGLQGLLGWYMVKSGLVDVPAVSHYRLAAHLSLAFFVACWIAWILFDLRPAPPGARRDAGAAALAWAFVAVLSLQIVYGAFMAGSRAGFMYSTWPDMNGVYVPEGMTLTNHVGIHFVHRTLGYVVGLAGVGLWLATRGRATTPAQRRGGRWVAALVGVQVALGVTTILLNGRLQTHHGLHPLHIAVAAAHQGVALLLLTAAVYLGHAFGRRPRPARQPAPATGHLHTSTDAA